VRFGERLQQLRQQAKLSQSELAQRAGLSVKNIHKWEGTSREPRAGALFRLAAALGVTCLAFADCTFEEPEEKAGKAPKRTRGRPRKAD